MKKQDILKQVAALSKEAKTVNSARKQEIAEQMTSLMMQEDGVFEVMAAAGKFSEIVDRVGLSNAQGAVMRFSKENDHIKRSVEEFFGMEDIEFETKEVGLSSGIKAIIGDKKFHLKCYDSHSRGHIDPRELFVYKVLELSGFGPKIHAIPGIKQASVDGYYIATQDMSYSKNPNKRKEFTAYEDDKEREEDKLFDTIFKDNLRFRQEVMALEILCNCLSLRDTFENPGNFGITCINSEDGQVSYKPKLIDFKNTGSSYSAEEIRAKSANSFTNKKSMNIGLGDMLQDYPQAILFLTRGRKSAEKDIELIFKESKEFVSELMSSGPRSSLFRGDSEQLLNKYVEDSLSAIKKMEAGKDAKINKWQERIAGRSQDVDTQH